MNIMNIHNLFNIGSIVIWFIVKQSSENRILFIIHVSMLQLKIHDMKKLNYVFFEMSFISKEGTSCVLMVYRS